MSVNRKLPNQLDLSLAPVRESRSASTALVFDSENPNSKSRAHQSFKSECNVNNIMAKYRRTGVLTHLSSKTPQYGDFTNVSDYQSALLAVQDANDSFMSLPAKLRSQFDNDPAAFLAFAEKPENANFLVDLGLSPKIEDTPIVGDLNSPKVPS